MAHCSDYRWSYLADTQPHRDNFVKARDIFEAHPRLSTRLDSVSPLLCLIRGDEIQSTMMYYPLDMIDIEQYMEDGDGEIEKVDASERHDRSYATKLNVRLSRVLPAF